MTNQCSGDRSINLELFHDDGARDAENLGQFTADLVEALLVQEDIVVELVLDLGLGPGLLLCLGTLGFVSLSTLRGARTLIFDRLLCFSLQFITVTLALTPSTCRAGRSGRATRPPHDDDSSNVSTLLTIFVCRSDDFY